jgi:hypothetical protein
MSCWTTTVPNSVRKSAPVGQTSRQPAWVQCLQTSEIISQRKSVRISAPDPEPGSSIDGIPRSTGAGLGCSMNATCRQAFAPSAPVLSNDIPSRSSGSSEGTPFHCLHATSQALQPMHTEVSVKKPTRGGWSTWPASPATSSSGPYRLVLMCRSRC